MKFNYPDKLLEKASRYYLRYHTRRLEHDMLTLARIKPEYLHLISPFSFDDERYELYPNHGWIERDYEQMLSLDLTKAQDKDNFRLLAANLVRVIMDHPPILQKMKEWPHFDKILEFSLVEGLYEYFNIEVEDILVKCVQQKVINSGDCGLISAAKTMIFKQWYDSLNFKQRIYYKFVRHMSVD